MIASTGLNDFLLEAGTFSKYSTLFYKQFYAIFIHQNIYLGWIIISAKHAIIPTKIAKMMNSLIEGRSELTLPVLMTRRRPQVGRKYNTSTVIGDYAPNSATPPSFYKETFSPKPQSNISAAGRMRKSDVPSTGFLLENPMFINEPICVTSTKNAPQHEWWPPETTTSEHKVTGKYTRDSVMRSDYLPVVGEPHGTRFGCNPRHSTNGCVVPLRSEKLLRRPKVSYEHHIDCRKGRIERGKRLGAFVWGVQ